MLLEETLRYLGIAFVSSALLIFMSKIVLQFLIRRPADYYSAIEMKQEEAMLNSAGFSIRDELETDVEGVPLHGAEEEIGGSGEVAIHIPVLGHHTHEEKPAAAAVAAAAEPSAEAADAETAAVAADAEAAAVMSFLNGAFFFIYVIPPGLIV